MLRVLIGVMAALCLAAAAAAEQPQLTPEQRAELQRLTRIRNSLHPVRGSIPLPEAKARLELGTGYYFLGPADARKVIVDAWGNRPEQADGVLGIVFPVGQDLISSDWGAVVTYESSGYVSDGDARSTDYDQLLNELRSGEDAENEDRKKQGYPSAHLVGWAQPPSYDAARHDLLWAREIEFGGEAEHTLNYDVRHLGRSGVLSLNMVATMSDLPQVRAAAQALARTAEFDAGVRYADHHSGDKTAGYGLAGLIAAGAGVAVAKKLGFLAVIAAFAKKGIALIVAVGAGIAAWFRRLFGKRSAAAPPAEDDQDRDEAA